ncbi:MAG: tetratricopeptide repeat protein, partial [Myxococcales bacterium]|nr:tetratricopeptide repeat protein [Myxococcales bacterium]
MSEVRTALLNYLRSLDANDAGGSAGGEELRAALSTALGDTDLAAARAEAKKDPASVDAVASLIARMILDEVDPKEIVNTAKVSAQRAPRNADGNDVALLAGLAVWKVGGDPKVAEPYFRRVRRGAPDNADLLAFYREVYSGEKDASQLMQVLVQARRAIKDDTAARLALAEEMADIAEHKLGSVDRAIEVWRSVLREDGYDPGAASALSRLYRAGEKWTALVELLKDQFERVEDGEAYKEERISRLLEIAEIYRDNLNLDAMALATLQRILEIDPRHDASLKALAETYGNAGRWNDLLAVYNRLASAAEAEGDTARQIDMLRRIAAIYLDELTDPEHGLAPLKTVLELDPGDRDALQLIARVHELRGDWDALLELLREQLDGADATEACELRVRIARVTQERFDVEQAQAAWNDVLQAHGDVEEALVALAAIYEKDGRWAEVAEMLHRRVKVEADPARAIELLTTLGQLYVDKLGDADASTRVWEEVARL